MGSQEELIERLTRFYREAGGEVSSMPPAWVPGKPRWLQPALASIVLVALAIGLAVTIRIVREEGQRKVTTTGPPPIVSPTPSPSASATPLSGWITRRVPIGPVVTMSLDSAAIFALYAPAPTSGGIDPSKIGLARIDRSSGAVATIGGFPYAKTLARVAAGLWVAAGPGVGDGTLATDTRWLTLVDLATLSVKQRVHLPAQADSGSNPGPQLAGASNLLWLGYGHSLYRLDPSTGRILLTVSVPGTVTSISIDPSGHRLYTASVGGQTAQTAVTEWDASTGGHVVSATTGGGDLGGATVVAAADGIWIAYATGMMGAVEFRSASDLSMVVGPQSGHTNGVRLSVGGGAVWFVDEGGGRLACADPRTGTIAASSQETFPVAVVADANGSYLGDFDGVGFLRPDPSCPH